MFSLSVTWSTSAHDSRQEGLGASDINSPSGVPVGCTSNVIVIHLCMFSDHCAHPKGRFNFLTNATVLLSEERKENGRKQSLEEIASHTEGLWYGIHWTERQGT